MIKLLTILLIAFLPIFSLSAEVLTVKLDTFVKGHDPVYGLYYGKDQREIKNYQTKIIVSSLNKSSKTDNFSLVLIKSNMNKELNVQVAVEPSEFTTILNKNNKRAKKYNSGITPSVNYTPLEGSCVDCDNVYHYTVKAGIYSNLLVARFNLSWDGDPDLPSGEYLSDIKIEYSIE